ncbi:MAG: thioredoxin family protein [Bacteroidetes bacterium]|nr:thioredoxin family protein [Bacteroidota bacterium]
MKKIISLVVIVLLTIQGLFAQIFQDPTTWSFKVKKVQGNDYELTIHCTLKPEWHLWSIDPGGDGLLIPPSFTFNKNSDIEIVGKIKEKGKRIDQEFPGTDGVTHFYENEITYTQKFKAKKNTVLKGTIKYQSCNHTQCLKPEEKPFEVSITDVEVAGIDSTNVTTTIDTTAQAIPATAQGSDTPQVSKSTTSITPVKDPKTSEVSSGSSNAYLLFSGLGYGLISVFTPCVFAMLPMTVSFFLKRSKDRKTGIKNALTYSLSIILIFTILGALISFTLGGNALNSIATNWIVNIVFFLVFMLFGISFLGAFEITLPSSWSTVTDKNANSNSFMGIFFMALTLVIVSFSCTGPFIGNLVVEISKGGKMGALFGFLGFSIGMALPFSLFAMFPSWLNKLSQSGGWLNAVKVTFGIVEIALALKFLSNADLANGWRLLDREIFIAIWIVLSLILTFYLLGFIRFSHDTELPKNDWGLTYLSIPRLFFAITAFSFAVYLVPGLWGAPLKGMSAMIPPMGTQDFVLGSQMGGGGEHSASTTPQHKYADKLHIYEPEVAKKFGLETYYDYDEALAASKREKKPIFLDFTGVNCVNCRKMEAQVWSDPEVMKRMKERFIVASLFADVDNIYLPESEQYDSKFLGSKVKTIGDKNEDIQATKFNSNSQPYYFFIDENENKLAEKGYGYDPDAAKFVQHLDAVLAQFDANNKQ